MNHSEESGTTVPDAGPGVGPDAGPGVGPGVGAGFGVGPYELLGRAFPRGDWGDPAERLDELYQWVEEGALRTAGAYLAARRAKRRAARALRAGAVVCAAAGAALPVAGLAAAGAGLTGWGLLGLVAAGACVAADRWFGLTAGWMRDVATAQAVLRRLESLQFDWASEGVREVLGPVEGTAGEAAERCVGMLRRFTEDVTEVVRAETADWMLTAGGGPSARGALALQATTWARPVDPPPPRGPFPAAGLRPTMPRQRPPDPG